MHNIRRILRTSMLIAVFAVPAVALAAPGPKTVFAITCLQEKYKPTQITVACADGTVRVSQVNRCNPDCAAGHTGSFPVTITLSRPKACPGRKHKAFGRLSYAFGSNHPRPTPRHTSLPCPEGPLPPGY